MVRSHFLSLGPCLSLDITQSTLPVFTEHRRWYTLSANVSLMCLCVCVCVRARALRGNVRKTNHATPVAKNWFVQLSLLQKIQYLWNTQAHPDYITFHPSEPHSRLRCYLMMLGSCLGTPKRSVLGFPTQVLRAWRVYRYTFSWRSEYTQNYISVSEIPLFH